jgi:Cof subfamily protein (haloacid dehalogenase superfamily)
MDVRLLLFDLDGTLLGPSRRVSEANARALDRAMDQGIRVGFATGRSLRSARPWIEELRPTGPLILFNGGLVWDVVDDQPLLERHLPRVDARAALAVVAELGVHANLYLGEDITIAQGSAVALASEVKDGVPHTIVGDLVAHLDGQPDDPFKILCIEERGGIEALTDRLRGVLSAGSVLVNSEPTYVEVLPPGVSKGAALSAVTAHTGIAPDEMIAFGDGLNDVELLAAAGQGVAMGNAHPRLQETADIVIGPHDTDAIAAFLATRVA